jgi:CO/xanthine dehydrogenase Mo-binding subunit
MIRSTRPDADAKLAGAVTFGVDLDQAGMRFGALVLAPRAHARVVRVDLAPARALPGVIAIGADDVPALLEGGTGDPERPPFARGEVTYHGQPVAAVAAPTLAEARAAAAAVQVSLDPLPIVADLETVFPEWPGSEVGNPAAIAAHVRARRGDVDRALRDAETVVRGTYRTSGVHQVALEPHACLAEVHEGRWHVLTSTQSPFGVREDVAAILGIPERSIVVEGTWVGGGFGGKGASLVEPYALLLARACHAPVRLALSYREVFRLGRTTLPSVVRMETGVSAGRIVARRVRLLLDVGSSLPGRDFATGYAIGFLLGPYRTPAFEVEGYAVRTHKPPFGPHRAPYAPQAAFVVESHLEEVALAIGEDPAAFRARHLYSEGDRTPLGQEVSAFGLPEALRQATARRDAWKREAPRGHGVGLAVGFWATNTSAGGEARVTLSPAGLEIVQGEREIGSGSVAIGLAATAERSTGLPRERIRISYRDTAEAPFDAGVFGSRTVGALGRAVDEACRALLERLGDRLGGTGPVRLEAVGQEVVAARGGLRRPVRELLTEGELRDGGLSAEGRHTGPPRAIDETLVLEGGFYPFQDFTGAAHVAEVDVDRETGAVRVLRYAAFHDVGVVLDRPSATAQVEGGVAMGLGTALTEESIWSDDARLLNPGLLDYRIPTLGEVPPIEVTFVEGFAGAGPFGAKGLGEPPIIPVPATVAAAIRDATGAALSELPFTAERVARALKLV